MKFDNREFCIRLEVDVDGNECLALYEGSLALGASIAECAYSDVGSTLALHTFESDVPPTAVEWLREQAQSRLLAPGAPLPDLEMERKPLWYYLGGAVILLGSAAYQWRHDAAHGGAWTALLAVAAGLFLLTGYLQYRSGEAAENADAADDVVAGR